MDRISFAIGTGCLLLALAGCGKEQATSAAETLPASQPAMVNGERVVHLESEQVNNIQVAPVKEQTLPVLFHAHGKVQFNDDRTALVVAPLSGRVENLKVRVGDIVHQGDVLFWINSRDVSQAVDDYLEAKQDLELAEKTMKMTQDLFNHNATSSIALQQAQNDWSKDKAKLARTQQQLRTLDVDAESISDLGAAHSLIPIKSPIDGIVVERHMSERQFVQPENSGLLTIADLSSVWVVADVFEKDLSRIRLGQKGEVKTLAYPDAAFQASVSQISSVLDPQTRTIKVRFLVENEENRLKPEMFAEVKLILENITNAVVLPATSVFTEGGQNRVFVGLGGNNYVDRPVEVSMLPERKVRILSGLHPGDTIVTQGALLLRAQQTMTSEDD